MRDVDPSALAIWLQEFTQAVADLPHDLVAFAFDEAVRETTTGFMPTVGQVRMHAKPLLAQRAEQIDRLGQMEAALADPVATEERRRRRFEMEAYQRDMARREQREQYAREREAREAEKSARTPTPMPLSSDVEGMRRWR